MDYRFLLAALGLVTCVQVAWADDSPAIQSKLNACYAGTGSCNIDFQGARKTIGATLKVDPEYVTLRNAVFDCVMTSGTCLYVSEEGFPRARHPGSNRLEGLAVYGSKSIDGITMNYPGNDNVTNAATTLFNISLQGFNHGLVLGSGVWGADMHGVVIGNGNVGIYIPPDTKNAGELSTFVSGTVYNNAVAGLDEESNVELSFLGTRFDFNNQQMLLSGPTSFSGHIENFQNGKPEIVLKALPGVPAGSIYMSPGTTITVDQWNAASPQQPCYIQTSLPWNRIVVPATLWGFGGTQGAVCGPGKVVTWDRQAPDFQ